MFAFRQPMCLNVIPHTFSEMRLFKMLLVETHAKETLKFSKICSFQFFLKLLFKKKNLMKC